jgi:xanthine dehydrogenase accessory factor
MKFPELALSRLADETAVWVTVQAVQGSVPRDAGTAMAVFSDSTCGTIGGGRVEFEAIAEARRRLCGAERGTAVLRYPLGPALGQCCGGVMHLRFDAVTAADIPSLRQRMAAVRAPVALFGGGHVGHALVEVLARLPFALTWIDSRDGIFPQQLPAHVVCEHSEPVQGAVDGLAAGSAVLVMSFSHAEDLDVVAQCLRRQRAAADLASIGLIGSATKWATFRHRLQERGFRPQELDQVRCPIGLPGIAGKEPEVIAIAVAAQLLQDRIV